MFRKRFVAFILSGILLGMSFVPILPTTSSATEANNRAVEDEKDQGKVKLKSTLNLEDYYLDSKDFVIGSETGFYSWDLDGKVMINKDSVIVYETEDGVKHEYKPIKRKGSEKYSFLINLNTVGTWKLISIDGQKVDSDFLNIVVHKDKVDLLAAESSKIVKAIKEGEEIERRERLAPSRLNITRIKGTDRYDTAVKASKEMFPNGAKYVAIASGENYIDGLVGGSLTSEVGFPLLLAQKNNISQDTINEIKRLNPKEVFILGGKSSVSIDVEKQINDLGFKVERLAGVDRKDTAGFIGSKRYTLKYSEPLIGLDSYAFINGTSFADSLSAAPFIGAMSRYTELGMNFLVPLTGSNIKAGQMIFGGTNMIPASENDKIRFSGNTRYETAVEVAKAYKSLLKIDIDTVVLVSGENFPDGLTAAEIAGEKKAAVLLTNANELDYVTKGFIKNNKNIKNVIILGGDASVSQAVEKELKGIK